MRDPERGNERATEVPVQIPDHLVPIFDVWFAPKPGILKSDNPFAERVELLLLEHYNAGIHNSDGGSIIREPFDVARAMLEEVVKESEGHLFQEDKSNMLVVASREAVRGNVEATKAALEQVSGQWTRMKRPTLAMAYFAKALLAGYMPTTDEGTRGSANRYIVELVDTRRVVDTSIFREMHTSFDCLSTGLLLLGQELSSRRYLP